MKLSLICLFLFVSCASQDVYKWPSRNITYSIDAIHLKGVDVMRANIVIHRAFKAWEDTEGVKFKHVMHGDIKVSMKDLQGDLIGFGYFPSDGRLHLDSSDRTWTEDLLYRVTLHEIAHCLGITHSYNKNSVVYHRITSNDKITYWDKRKVQLLYLTNNK